VAPGGPHAEVAALRKAGERARGATFYVNLEPCAHHGRTPPCVEAVLAAGAERVVIGMVDPDPRTAGRSVDAFRRRGVRVSVGIEQEACERLNRGFSSRVRRGRPFTVLKLASSWDGRVATASGDSRWITGERARAHVHELRVGMDAIVVGSRTARADDPELTARRAGRIVRAPRRIVVDSQLRVDPGARMLDRELPGETWLLTDPGAPASRRAPLEAAGARIVPSPMDGAHLDLRQAWNLLGREGLNEVLVEGGGELAAALIRAECVDELLLFLAPLLIGGDGRPVVGELGVDLLAQAPRPRSFGLRRFGEDLLIRAEW